MNPTKKESHLIPIEIPLYRTSVIFMYGGDYKLLKKWVSRDMGKSGKLLIKTINTMEARRKSYAGTYVTNDNYDRVIHIKPQRTLAKFMNILSHEILHSVHDILQHVGLTLTDSSEEAYTYLQGYLTETILEQMLKPK